MDDIRPKMLLVMLWHIEQVLDELAGLANCDWLKPTRRNLVESGIEQFSV